ncbi:MAG: hypothetical protein ACO3M5_01935 [Saprospiraceae bacterium]
MNLEKTSLVLKKINRLYELIQSLGEASHTEKDLLKAYVLDLYEAVALSDEDEMLEDFEIEEMKEKMNKLKKQENKLKKELEKKMEKAESMSDNYPEDNEELEDESSEEKEGKTEKESPAKPEEPEEEESAEEELAESLSEEMIQLFDIKDSTELSDRLANAPIADLTKAMGINEKIFTVNELFDGNKEEMDNILRALNNLTDFEEAKSVLARSVAPKYKWLEKQRLKKARNFIRLVRRRYIA